MNDRQNASIRVISPQINSEWKQIESLLRENGLNPMDRESIAIALEKSNDYEIVDRKDFGGDPDYWIRKKQPPIQIGIIGNTLHPGSSIRDNTITYQDFSESGKNTFINKEQEKKTTNPIIIILLKVVKWIAGLFAIIGAIGSIIELM